MKLIREHINEKFEEESDPIRDMGIGAKKVIIDRAKNMFYNAQYDEENGGNGFRISEIRFDAFVADIITNYPFAIKAVQEWLIDEFERAKLDEFFNLKDSITYGTTDDHIFWNIDFKEKYEKTFSMEDRIVINYKTINESLNEKFTEEGDPIKQMGIGMKHQIKKWIKTRYNYIEEDLLWICARHGKTEFVKYLLDAGADVHADDDAALQWACYEGHTEIVKILLDAGADVHAENDFALQTASYNGHTEIVKILKDHIAKEKKNKVVKESLSEKFVKICDVDLSNIRDVYYTF